MRKSKLLRRLAMVISLLLLIPSTVNTTYGLKGDKAFDKSHPLMMKLKEVVDREYDEGRVTVMTDDELFAMIHEFAPEYGLSFPEL